MNTPPLLLGSVLFFWGWQTGLLWIALPAAALLEGSRWVKWRLDLEQDHYVRLWNLTELCVIGLAMYMFFAQGGYSAVTDMVERGQSGVRAESLRSMSQLVLRTVQLIPVALLLFMTVFAYGPARELPVATFSLIYRRLAEKAAAGATLAPQPPALNPTHAFAIVVLLAAGASREHPGWYFALMALLIGWMLWPRRSPNVAPWAWGGALLVAIGVAFSSQAGLLVLQKLFEQWQNRLMSEYGRGLIDNSQSRTSMGRSGEMKQSGRIIWRVQPGVGQNSPPALLREAVFNRFEQPEGGPERTNSPPTWTSRQRKFEPVLDSAWNRSGVERAPERTYTWILNSNAAPSRSVTVTGYTKNGEANVPLPAGAIMVTDRTASVLTVQTNAMGAARILGGQALAVLEMRHGSGGGFEGEPNPDDLSLTELAPADARAIARVAGELKLASATPDAALAIIRLFFFNHFAYSLELEPPRPGSTNDTPLASFLLEQRRGHCEYFASATALLLRAAGIPSRYVIGYSIQEKRSNNEFVARSRHAHAWALAWINGRWVEVDCTPAGWFESEWAEAGAFEAWRDWFSDAWLGFQRWRQSDSQVRFYVLIGGILALGFLAWRQVAGKSWRRTRSRQPAAQERELLGLDSEFYEIERALSQFRPRDAAESLGAWLAKLELLPPILQPRLQALLALHYRHRFDPVGLPAADRDQLRNETRRWLADLRACQQPAMGKR